MIEQYNPSRYWEMTIFNSMLQWVLVYLQCTNGHLMCASCLSHLLADARLKDETATCPNCRCEISKTNCIRNLAVEKAISELPSECDFCGQQFPRCSLEHHMKERCPERYVRKPWLHLQSRMPPAISWRWFRAWDLVSRPCPCVTQ